MICIVYSSTHKSQGYLHYIQGVCERENVCVCVFECVCAHVRQCVWVCARVRQSVCVHVCKSVRECVCTLASTGRPSLITG